MTDPYEALQDDLEAMSLANAGLLVEVAELTAIVESVRKIRDDVAECVDLANSKWQATIDPVHRGGAAAFRAVRRSLDEVDGL